MVYVIVNELRIKSKKGLTRLNTVEGVFKRAGTEYEICRTTHPGHARELAEEITSSAGEHTIVAMGGDGTLHEILNGFKDFENNHLGLIPFGTGNDFAAAANIPCDVKRAAEIIAFHAPTYIDFIQFGSGLRSLNAVGMGIDVEVLRRAYGKNAGGKGKYLKALISTLFKFKGIEFTVDAGGGGEKRFGLLAAVGNGKQIGGGIKVFPNAQIDDGYLDLIVVDYISRAKIIGAFIKLMRGKVNSVKGATVQRVTSVKLNTSTPFYIQAEGELYENVPIDVHIETNKLKFYL